MFATSFLSSTSHRLVLVIVSLLAIIIAMGAVGVSRERHIAATVQRVAEVDMQRIGLLSEINEHANDGARKLIVLLTAERDQRVLAYTEIDAASRRLDSSMLLLAKLLELGEQNSDYRTIQDSIRRYRQAYGDTADLIEAQDLESARRAIVTTTDFELSMLIASTQNLDRTEQHKVTQRLEALGAELGLARRTLLALGATGLLLSLAMCWWVIKGVAAPLRAVAEAARRFAAGDYAGRLPVRGSGEVSAISAAFNGLADGVQQREAELRRLIDFDPLTGLSQRDRFMADQRPRVAAAAAAGGERLVVLCFDIARLKSINALLGFDAGDQAIVEVARRAAAHVGQAADVARLGAGTFAAVLVLAEGQTAERRAAAFQQGIEGGMRWIDHALDLTTTVGLALCPAHGETPQELMRRAEQALFDAKRQRAACALYSPSIEAARLSHLSLLSELQQAIEGGQLLPFLQPKLCLMTGRIVGAEALVRWRHPQRGWVSPAEFIPFAERTGRVTSITRCMLEQGVRLLRDRLPGHIKLAVNISTYDLRDAGFADDVAALLALHGVAADRLQVEVTESGLLDSGEDPIRRLAALRRIGVGVAIDDFGTGQSSLAYLQRLPADELKIDRSFVSDIDSDDSRATLLASVIALGHGLGKVVTAEGAETAGELALLKRLGCDMAQGYHIGRPVPVDEFVARFCAPLAVAD